MRPHGKIVDSWTFAGRQFSVILVDDSNYWAMAGERTVLISDEKPNRLYVHSVYFQLV